MPASAPILRATVSAILVGLVGCSGPVALPEMTLPEDPGIQAALIPESRSVVAAPVATTPGQPPEEEGDSREVFAAAQQAGQGDMGAQTALAMETPVESAGYQTIGAMLAEVNGKPIFSEDVIGAVRNELRGLATQQAEKSRFVDQARSILERELRERINDEMLRLVAERNLTRSDRERALFAATQYRVNRITAAGGSEARAREQALAEFGITLEKLVEETEQRFLFQLFVQAVIWPRAIPSAQEMRDYFLRHRDVFSGQGRGEIEFLVIEMNPTGPANSPEEMRVRAEHVQSLAAAGEDFGKLAAEYNDNGFYKANAGAVPGMPLGRGDFRWPAVDAAVWGTAEGGVTPVIAEEGGNRLFIAKVVRKSEPQAMGFDEVQERIRAQIADQRRMDLIRQYLSEAEKYAAVTPPEQIEENLRAALEVVSQQYAAWRAE